MPPPSSRESNILKEEWLALSIPSKPGWAFLKATNGDIFVPKILDHLAVHIAELHNKALENASATQA